MQIVLRKFDPSTIGDGKICVIIGKRGSGKTVLAKDILYYKRRLAMGICCSGTEEGNGWYQQFIPSLYVYNDFDKAAVERLVTRQKKLRKQGLTNPVFCIWDDTLYDKRILRDKLVRQIFMNGRHWHIFLMITAQYMLDIGPDLRGNIDYVFILREPIRSNREKLWKNFGGIFPTFEQFSAVLDSVTENYGCLVIDNTSKSNAIEDVAFWYTANSNRTFRMGSKALWRYHDTRYDPDHDHGSSGGGEKDAPKKNVVVIKKKK